MLVFWENCISPTPNTYFGKRIAPSGAIEDGDFWATIANAFCKMTSRLRKTHLSKKLHFPTSVSSTPNAHSENRVSSRLWLMLLFPQLGLPIRGSYYTPKQWVAWSGWARARVPRRMRPPRVPWASRAWFLAPKSKVENCFWHFQLLKNCLWHS